MPARTLLEVSDLSSIPGGGWLAIGIVAGWFAGLLTGAVSCWFYRRKAQKTGRDLAEPDAHDAPLAWPVTNTAKLPVADKPLQLPPSAITDGTSFSPLTASMQSVNLRSSQAPPSGTPRSQQPAVASPTARQPGTPSQQQPTIATINPAALGGDGFIVVEIPRPAGGPAANPASVSVTKQALDSKPTAPQLSTDAWGAAPQPAPIPEERPVTIATSTGPTSSPPRPHSGTQRAASRHARNESVASEYQEDELDSEWQVLLGDVDRILVEQRGASPLTPQERAVAVRRLLALTGSKGLTAALDTAVQDVLRHRSRQP